MPAVTRPLYVEQGATFKLGFNWHRESATEPGAAGEPYDLTGAIVRMQIRKTQQTEALVDASTVNGKIAVAGPAGRIDVLLAPADTNLLTSKSALYDLEVEFTTGSEEGHVYRLLEGAVTVSPNITQADGEPKVGS